MACRSLVGRSTPSDGFATRDQLPYGPHAIRRTIQGCAPTGRAEEGVYDMCRKTMWGVLVIGVLMVVAPFAMGLPSKTAAGEELIDAFDPIMTDESVELTVNYYYDVFVPLGGVAPAMSQENIDRFNAYLEGFGGLQADAQLLIPALAVATGVTEEEAQAFVASQFPAMAQMLQTLPDMQEDFTSLLGLMAANVEYFEQTPAGLAHYKPLIDTMQEQQDNYWSAASMPDFRLFTWFIVVPGALLVVLALLGLFVGRSGAADDDAAPIDSSTDDDELVGTA